MLTEKIAGWLIPGGMILLAAAPVILLALRLGPLSADKRKAVIADIGLILLAAVFPLALAWLYYAHSGGPDTPAQIAVPAVIYGAMLLLGAVCLVRDVRRT